MKKNSSQKSWNFQHAFFLSVFVLICYWPLSFGIFSAKNDNITQFLPVRFHVSEALINGRLPLWSPYMYLGYPIHGDMQGGAWNPVVWMLSFFGRYTLTSLHFEIILYLIFAGLGMYRLLTAVSLQPRIRLIGSIAYVTCGFITDVAGSNAPFLAAAAYIPFVFAYFYMLLLNPLFSYAIKCAIFLSLLLVSGYPSFFICTFYILLSAFIVIIAKNLNKERLKKLFLSLSITLIVFLCLSAPAILSYLHVLPHYSRGGGVSINEALVNSFHPSCSLSFVLPTAPIKNPASFDTDLISRNSYFNIILLAFVPTYIWIKKSLFLNFVAAGIVFFFLFSLGEYTPIRAICYKFLPLMNTFRHPANARLFVIIAGIILSLVIYQKVKTGSLSLKYLQIVVACLIAVIILTIIFSLSDISLISDIKTLFAHSEARDQTKKFLDALTFDDIVFINGIIQIPFLVLLLLLIKRLKSQNIILLIAINSFLLSQYSIPYTVASKNPPTTINALLKSIPKGYPVPDRNTAISVNSQKAFLNYETIGISHLYDKKIAIADTILTPTFMTVMRKVKNNPSTKKDVLTHPYAYFKDNSGFFTLTKFNNNEFLFSTVTNISSTFILQQLNMPGWKCFVSGKKAKIVSNNIAFMEVNVPPGKNDIRFEYRPAGIGIAFILSVVTVLVIIFIALKKRISVS